MKFFVQAFLLCGIFASAAFGQCNLSKPKDLTATAITSCSISLSWTPVPGVSYYQLRYKQGSGDYVYVNTFTNASWQLSGLLPQKNYSFNVASFCANGETKGYSKQVKVKTLTCDAPENIQVLTITK